MGTEKSKDEQAKEALRLIQGIARIKKIWDDAAAAMDSAQDTNKSKDGK